MSYHECYNVCFSLVKYCEAIVNIYIHTEIYSYILFSFSNDEDVAKRDARERIETLWLMLAAQERRYDGATRAAAIAKRSETLRRYCETLTMRCCEERNVTWVAVSSLSKYIHNHSEEALLWLEIVQYIFASFLLPLTWI